MQINRQRTEQGVQVQLLIFWGDLSQDAQERLLKLWGDNGNTDIRNLHSQHSHLSFRPELPRSALQNLAFHKGVRRFCALIGTILSRKSRQSCYEYKSLPLAEMNYQEATK